MHGTTLVTNAVISGNMAKTALLTNEGYEDMLFFGLGSRGKPPSEMFKTHQDYPDPIIPRHLIAGIRGRINAEGGIETELDEAGIRAAVAEFKRRNVESARRLFPLVHHESRARGAGPRDHRGGIPRGPSLHRTSDHVGGAGIRADLNVRTGRLDQAAFRTVRGKTSSAG